MILKTARNGCIVVANYSKIGVLPKVKKDGFVFVGWFTQPNGQGEQVTPNTEVNTDITIYAHYRAGTWGDELSGTWADGLHEIW